LLLTFLALSLVMMAVDARTGPDSALDRVRDLSQAIVMPIQRGVSAVTRPVGDLLASIGALARLRETNRELEAEVAKLRTEVDQARDLADENAELRASLELDESWISKDRVVAQVIADAPGNYKWAVVIDKGQNHGIREDMAVVDPDGLVGKIIHADARQATVLLLIDPSLGAAARTDDGGVAGVISGRGEASPLSLEFVENDEDILVGARVLTSNYNGGIFPPGIPIGHVARVGGDRRAAELDIDVEPYVAFDELNVVEVLLDTGKALAAGAAP